MTSKVQIEFEAQVAEAQRDIERLENAVNELERTTAEDNKTNLTATGVMKGMNKTWTEFNNQMNVVKGALDTVKGGVDATVGVFLDYAAQVRDVTAATGLSVNEVSRMIEVADDAGVSVGTLKMALREMGKDGVAPTVDELANLSDEFKKIQDPAQRTQFLMDAFGRSGLEMGKLMEQSSASIREAAAVIDDDMARSAREAEVAFDALDDAVRNVKIAIGAGLTPTLISAAKAAELLVTWSDRIKVATAEHEKEVIKTAETYQDYIDEMQRTAEAQGKTLQTMPVLTRLQYEQQRAIELTNLETMRLTRGVTEATQAQENYGKSMRPPTDMLNEQAKVLEYQTQAAKAAKDSEEALRAAKDNSLFVWREATQAVRDSNLSLDVQKAMLDAIALANGSVTAEQIAQREAIQTLTAQYESGKITQQQYLDMVNGLADGTLSAKQAVDNLSNAIRTMPDGKTITIKTVYLEEHGFTETGAREQKRHSGGPVSAGVPYIVGEKGPELFVPNQSGQIISNQNITNNLTVNSAMAPIIPAEFGRLNALAGAL